MDPSTQLLLNQFVGRMHPLVVHFPIGLLILAGLLEVFRRREKPSDAALICLVVGSLGAVVAAYSGWQFFEHDGPGPSRTMWLHRWGGVTVASLSFVCIVLGLIARRGTRPKVMSFFRGGVVLCMVLTAFVAHQGGESVWGDGFLFDVFEEEELVEDTSGESELVLPVNLEKPEALETSLPVAASTGVDYATRIQPLLEASCYRCHGPKKRPKAGLRLSDMPGVFAGAQEDWVIQPGNSGASPLFQRITLPTDHEDFMPSKGDPLTPAAVSLIQEWIDQGAQWTADEAGEVEAVAVEPEAEIPVIELLEPLSLEPAEVVARDMALELILASGAHAGRIALNTDEVEVNLGLLAERADDDSLALLAGLESCLVSLDLSRSAVSSAGLAGLAAFPRLRRLRLDHTAVDDAGMSHVAVLGALEYLNLVATSVGDAGLASLEGLRGLRKVFLWQTPVTDAGVERLAQALPELEIVRDTYTPVVAEVDAPVRSAACCDAAEAAGKDCDHPCCVEAAAKGEVCPECGV